MDTFDNIYMYIAIPIRPNQLYNVIADNVFECRNIPFTMRRGILSRFWVNNIHDVGV